MFFLTCRSQSLAEMMKRDFVLLSLLLSPLVTFSQSFIQPNYGLKSHETLVIKKIEATPKATTFFMTIENRIQEGSFCADKNIFIVYPDGSKSKLVSSGGIPVCPDSYKFKTPGEKLEFTLTFAPLKQGVKWADLVEECNDNCFSFYGILVDNDLNRKFDEAFTVAENEEPGRSIISFIDLLEETDSENLGIEGLLYVNIIRLANEAGRAGQAAEYYKKLKSSDAQRVLDYIKYLNTLGIKY